MRHKNGSTYLKERILSDVVREGPIYDQCVKMLGWEPDQVTLYKNIVTKPHVDRNDGESFVLEAYAKIALIFQDAEIRLAISKCRALAV